MQMQQIEPPLKAAPSEKDGREDKKEAFEAAARKLDVDENYDDDGDDAYCFHQYQSVKNFYPILLIDFLIDLLKNWRL